MAKFKCLFLAFIFFGITFAESNANFKPNARKAVFYVGCSCAQARPMPGGCQWDWRRRWTVIIKYHRDPKEYKGRGEWRLQARRNARSVFMSQNPTARDYDIITENVGAPFAPINGKCKVKR